MDFKKAVLELKRGSTDSVFEQAVQRLAADTAYHVQEHAEMTGRTITGNDTPTKADDGLLMTYDSAGVGTVTISPDADGLWSGSHTLTLYIAGAGIPAFAAGSGVTLRNSGGKTGVQYGFLSVVRVGANTWAVC